MLTIIHAADLHLDAPFAALSATEGAKRREEQRTLLTRLTTLAKERGADMVLLAGDLLDGTQTYYETTQALLQSLGEMDCPVFISPGNHDFYQPSSPYGVLSWPKQVHIFSQSAMDSVPLPHLNCVVHGAAFTSAHRHDDPLVGFTAPHDGNVHIGVLHGQVEEVGNYCPISPQSIATSGLSYLALGHIHQATDLSTAGATCWGYSGCPEGRGFDELGEKGAMVVTIDGDRVASEFVPLAQRRYEILTVDVTGQAPEDALRSALPAGVEMDIYRIILTGESNSVDIPALTQLATPYFYSVTIKDKTRPVRNLWARLQEDSLTGIFLRNMANRLEGATLEEREQIQLAVAFGLSVLENGEDYRL